MDRSTGGLALPRDCPRPATYRFERCVGLVACQPEIPNSTQRCGAVGFLRVHAEEDVNPRKYHDMEDVSEDEVDQIIQRYERDLADLEAGEFQR